MISVLILGAFYYYHRSKLAKEKNKYKKILHTFKMGDPKGLEALRKKILLNEGSEPLTNDNVYKEEYENLISENMAEFQKPKNAQMLPYDEDMWEVSNDRLHFQETLACKRRILTTTSLPTHFCVFLFGKI